MTYITQLTERTAQLALRIMATSLVCGAMLVLQSTAVQAQWTTNGNNINNTNTGNVGIGTTNPEVSLHVATESTATSRGLIIQQSNAANNSAFLILRKSRGTIASPGGIVNGDSLGAIYAEAHTGSAFLRTGANIKFVSNGTVAADSVPTDIAFSAGSSGTGTEYMRITSGGFVGIGTASPMNLFTVSGSDPSTTPGNAAAARLVNSNTTVNNSTALKFSTADSAGGVVSAGIIGTINTNHTQGSVAGDLFFSTASAGSPSEKMRITGGGSVGIGTASPLYSLDVNGGANGFRAKAATVSSSDAIATFENSSGIQGIVRGNGYVGLGTTSPGYKLDIQGGSLNSSGGLCIAGDCKTAWSQVGGSQWTTSGSNIYFNSGSVGVGTTSPAAKFAVTANTQNNGSFIVTPDGTNNYYAGNNHDAFFIDGSLTGPHGTYTSAQVRLLRIKTPFGDSLIVGRTGDTTLTPNTGYAASALKLVPDASNSYYAGSDYDVLQIGGNGLNAHGVYTGKTVRLIRAINAAGGDAFVVGRDGNATFGGNVTVTGNINAKYQDVAEWVESSQALAPGTVVVLDHTKSNQVIASGQAYDTRVAGVISSQPGIALGVEGAGKVLVATTGRVRIKVDASRGSIQVGDLLVTSGLAGLAMKSEPIDVGGVQIHRPGTLIGKALEPLAKGSGEILVLLSLQ